MDTGLNDLLALGVIGALLSIGFKFVSKNLSPLGSKLVIVLASIVLGGIYYWLRQSNYLVAVLSILSASQIVYGFFIKQTSDD